MKTLRKIAWRASYPVLERYRQGGQRVVNLTPSSGIGVGNLLSFWFWAYKGQLEGESRRAIRTPAMDPWLEIFPRLDQLVVQAGQVAFRDRRVLDWEQHFIDSDRPARTEFIQNVLLSSEALRAVDLVASRDVVVINVRRGDYYSVPRWRGLYGFDIRAYLDIATRRAVEEREIKRLVIVSDDPQWCRLKLGHLGALAPVEWVPRANHPVQHLALLSSASRLVLANSSFSYWAAYISNVRHQNNHGSVIAPRFHRRDLDDGRAWQLDPKWKVIEDIPGGWNS